MEATTISELLNKDLYECLRSKGLYAPLCGYLKTRQDTTFRLPVAISHLAAYRKDERDQRDFLRAVDRLDHKEQKKCLAAVKGNFLAYNLVQRLDCQSQTSDEVFERLHDLSSEPRH